jgi:quaternary ammonium compound-resistance protein SugE
MLIIMSAWIYILLADIFEVIWPFLLKMFGSQSWFVPLVVGVGVSIPIMYLLNGATALLPASTVYAAFVGIGVAVTTIIGMIFFHEPVSVGRMLCLAMVCAGVVGLRLF